MIWPKSVFLISLVKISHVSYMLPLQVRLALFFAELADLLLQDEINALVLFVWLQQLPRACFRHNVTKKTSKTQTGLTVLISLYRRRRTVECESMQQILNQSHIPAPWDSACWTVLVTSLNIETTLWYYFEIHSLGLTALCCSCPEDRVIHAFVLLWSCELPHTPLTVCVTFYTKQPRDAIAM